MMCAVTAPGQDYQATVVEYVQGVSGRQDGPPGIPMAASRTFQMLKRSCKAHPRATAPSVDEVAAFVAGKRLKAVVYFLGECLRARPSALQSGVRPGTALCTVWPTRLAWCAAWPPLLPSDGSER